MHVVDKLQTLELRVCSIEDNVLHQSPHYSSVSGFHWIEDTVSAVVGGRFLTQELLKIILDHPLSASMSGIG